MISKKMQSYNQIITKEFMITKRYKKISKEMKF